MSWCRLHNLPLFEVRSRELSPVTWRSRRGSSDDRATAVKHRRLFPVGGRRRVSSATRRRRTPPISERSPLTLVDGANLFAVLENRISRPRCLSSRCRRATGPAIRRSPSPRFSAANPPSGDAPPSFPPQYFAASGRWPGRSDAAHSDSRRHAHLLLDEVVQGDLGAVPVAEGDGDGVALPLIRVGEVARPGSRRMADDEEVCVSIVRRERVGVSRASDERARLSRGAVRFPA